jgi:hypothetical protein
MSLFTVAFWKDAFERAVKTVAGTEATLLLAQGTGLLNADWWASLSASGMAGVVSLLLSLASVKVGSAGTASLTSAVVPSAVTGGRHAQDAPFRDVGGTTPQGGSGSTSDGIDVNNVPGPRAGGDDE